MTTQGERLRIRSKTKDWIEHLMINKILDDTTRNGEFIDG